MIDLIFTVGLFMLIFAVLWVAWRILREVEWLKAVLIPYLATLAKLLNPDKK